MSDKKENLRCTIRVSACTGGGDPETPGYWDTHNHEILIDILDQGSKEENEKSVLKKLYEGEFTIELDEEQLGIEDLEMIFNKKSVIKAVEDVGLSSFRTKLESVVDSLQSSVYDLCWDIYVTTYSESSDDDDYDVMSDDYSEYPNNINEEAFYDVMKELGSDIVFEVEESRIPEASQPGVSMVARFGILRDSILKDEEDEG